MEDGTICADLQLQQKSCSETVSCQESLIMRDTRLMEKINHCRGDLHACGWHRSTTEELEVVSFALIKSVACAAPARGTCVCVCACV